MYDKYTAVCPRCFFLVMHPNIAFLGENKKRAKCEHTQNTSRYLAPNFGRYKPQDSHVRPVRYDPCGFFFLAMHQNIAVLPHYAYFVGSHTSTRLLRDGTRGFYFVLQSKICCDIINIWKTNCFIKKILRYTQKKT